MLRKTTFWLAVCSSLVLCAQAQEDAVVSETAPQETKHLHIIAYPNGVVVQQHSNIPVPIFPPPPTAPTDKMGLVMLAWVQEEIDLTKDQIAEIKKLAKDINASEQVTARLLPSDPTEIWDYIKEAKATLEEMQTEELKDILLPNQFKRLQQIQVQVIMRQSGVAGLGTPSLADLLGLNDEQKAHLLAKHREAEQELRREIERIRAELDKKILTEVLTPEQRLTLEDAIGTPIAPDRLDLAE